VRVNAIAGALRRAVPILFTARVIGLAILPLVIAAIVWIAIAVMAWDPLTGALLQWFGGDAGTTSLWQRIAAQVIAVLLFAALAVATALTAIAILTMPVIVKIVAARHFPGLAARRGGTLLGSARNAMVALLVFIPLWLVSLPLLVFPPLYVVVSLLLNAWLSQRMFRYDALAEHATPEEIATVLRENRTRLMGLGLALSPLSLIPIVNVLVLPIYAGVAFTELCLSELARLRSRTPTVT
jgi:CysZ protein